MRKVLFPSRKAPLMVIPTIARCYRPCGFTLIRKQTAMLTLTDKQPQGNFDDLLHFCLYLCVLFTFAFFPLLFL